VTYELGDGDRAALHAAGAALSARPPAPRRAPWWRRHLRWLVLGLVADLLVGTFVWRWLRDESSTPERAVERAVALWADNDHAGLRNALCAPDRLRYSVADIAEAARAANLVLRGVDSFEIDRVVPLAEVSLGPASLPARRVEGRVVAVLGPPSRAWVTVVQEPTAWKVCLSAGGYGLEAMGVDVPATGSLLQ
jgi:hypothetical protein